MMEFLGLILGGGLIGIAVAVVLYPLLSPSWGGPYRRGTHRPAWLRRLIRRWEREREAQELVRRQAVERRVLSEEFPGRPDLLARLDRVQVLELEVWRRRWARDAERDGLP